MNTCASVHVWPILRKLISREPVEGYFRNRSQGKGHKHGLTTRSLFKSKDAAAQIELIFVFGHPAPEGWHNLATNMFAAPGGLNDPGFAQNAKML